MNDYFMNSRTLESLAMLSKFQNDVLYAEYLLKHYFDMNTMTFKGGYSEQFSAIVEQNGSYIKLGESIEVTAGIGSFSASAKPTIIINGVKRNTNAEGVVIYTLKATDKPGIFSIPVKIQFTKPDDTIASVSKILKHTVAQ